MAKYQLIARAQINGAVQEPGFVFELKDGEKGPHRTVVSSNHGSNIAEGTNQQLVDQPLYVEYKEPAAPEKKFAPSVADKEYPIQQAPEKV